MKNEILKEVTRILLTVVIVLLVLLLLKDDYIYNSNTQSNNQTVNLYTENPERVNINTATKDELMTLPYIGDELADRIIAARPYNDVWELSSVEGIGETILSELIKRIEV